MPAHTTSGNYCIECHRLTPFGTPMRHKKGCPELKRKTMGDLVAGTKFIQDRARQLTIPGAELAGTTDLEAKVNRLGRQDTKGRRGKVFSIRLTDQDRAAIEWLRREAEPELKRDFPYDHRLGLGPFLLWTVKRLGELLVAKHAAGAELGKVRK